ncbi:MAG: PadR family transcriptional regulator [Firmicutes bacterium]|nr:PadR family transcriptional regulator [Bacillota bacterium]
MDAQIKKGLIDICVLATLSKGDSYGWQIIKDINQVMLLSESTLYPVLKRLETANMVTTYEQPHNGRLRRYFKITVMGKTKLGEFENEFKGIARVYNYIMASITEKNNKEEEE